MRAAYAFRQAMSQSMITGLRAIDLEGRITFVNAAFCRMTGFDESELVGLKPPYPYWPPEEFAAATHHRYRPWPARPRPAVSRCASCAKAASASMSASIFRR
jgi:PAS domain-containing protein